MMDGMIYESILFALSVMWGSFSSCAMYSNAYVDSRVRMTAVLMLAVAILVPTSFGMSNRQGVNCTVGSPSSTNVESVVLLDPAESTVILSYAHGRHPAPGCKHCDTSLERLC
jgi:hypothetical protein